MLITVDAVSRYVATVEIPSKGRCADASMRRYNEEEESQWATGHKTEYDQAGHTKVSVC